MSLPMSVGANTYAKQAIDELRIRHPGLGFHEVRSDHIPVHELGIKSIGLSP